MADLEQPPTHVVHLRPTENGFELATDQDGQTPEKIARTLLHTQKAIDLGAAMIDCDGHHFTVSSLNAETLHKLSYVLTAQSGHLVQVRAS